MGATPKWTSEVLGRDPYGEDRWGVPDPNQSVDPCCSLGTSGTALGGATKPGRRDHDQPEDDAAVGYRIQTSPDLHEMLRGSSGHDGQPRKLGVWIRSAGPRLIHGTSDVARALWAGRAALRAEHVNIVVTGDANARLRMSRRVFGVGEAFTVAVCMVARGDHDALDSIIM